jgi:hypothetical protein
VPELITITVITLLCVGIVVAGILMERAKTKKSDGKAANIIEIAPVDDNNEMYAELEYNSKFHYFLELCRFSKGGTVRVPSWDRLGDTEAERARNLLMIRENNITLVVEETGELIKPDVQPSPVFNR